MVVTVKFSGDGAGRVYQSGSGSSWWLLQTIFFSFPPAPITRGQQSAAERCTEQGIAASFHSHPPPRLAQRAVFSTAWSLKSWHLTLFLYVEYQVFGSTPNVSVVAESFLANTARDFRKVSEQTVRLKHCQQERVICRVKRCRNKDRKIGMFTQTAGPAKVKCFVEGPFSFAKVSFIIPHSFFNFITRSKIMGSFFLWKRSAITKEGQPLRRVFQTYKILKATKMHQSFIFI